MEVKWFERQRGNRELRTADEGRSGGEESYQHQECRLGEKTTLQHRQSSELHAWGEKNPELL